jgi:hypothetical protein
MMPESLSSLLYRLWFLYGTVLKSLLLVVLVVLAFTTDLAADLCARALRGVENWQPVQPAIFAIPERNDR